MSETPEVMPVTEEELKQLPLWALVAFAARCARRVKPVFIKEWPAAPIQHIRAMNEAITLAERSAFTGRVDDISAARNTVHEAIMAADAAFNAGASPADFAADTAAAAAAAAAGTDHAYATAAAMRAAAAPLGTHSFTAFTSDAARADFELLLLRATNENWTDATPVDFSILGSLWPAADPFNQTHETTATAPIDCYFDRSEFSAEDIAAILGGLSAFYNQLTGDELVIDDCGVADVSEAFVPAGGGA